MRILPAALSGTRMFCAGAMEQEQAVLTALGGTTRDRIQRDTLDLLAGADRAARFVARADSGAH